MRNVPSCAVKPTRPDGRSAPGARTRRTNIAPTKTCPGCGEPVEESFRLCPYCGSDLGEGGEEPQARSGGPVELLSELSGLDERTVPTLRALLRDPGEVAAEAQLGSRRYTRPVRIYLGVSFIAFAMYAFLGWILGGSPPPPPQAAPDEVSLTLDLQGPNIRVGDDVLAEIAEAGGVEAWIAETGRVTSVNPAWRVVGKKALQLRYEGRMEEVRWGFSQNRALVSLLVIPVLAVLLALGFFRRAGFRGHFDLAALIVTVVLLVDLLRRCAWAGVVLVARAAGVVEALGVVLIGVLALHGVVVIWYLGRSTRTFYRLGMAATLVATPLLAVLLLVVWVGCSWALNVAFILLA